MGTGGGPATVWPVETQVPSCYRHPDRPGGIVCQRCDRPICVQCMHQASVGFHCPECVKAGAQRVYQGTGALRTRPVVTQGLIIANVIVFLLGLLAVGTEFLSPSNTTTFHARWGLIAKGIMVHADGSRYLVGVGEGQWYRMITSGFLHYGWWHIALNMWALWILGSAVEQFAGRARMGWIYAVSLLAGSVGALILSPHALTAGASGAIFGLMGAIFLAHRAQGIPFRQSPLLWILVLNLAFTFGVGGISIGGHLGGLIGGAFAGYVFFDLERQRKLTSQAASVVCGVTCVGLILAGLAIASAASVI